MNRTTKVQLASLIVEVTVCITATLSTLGVSNQFVDHVMTPKLLYSSLACCIGLAVFAIVSLLLHPEDIAVRYRRIVLFIALLVCMESMLCFLFITSDFGTEAGVIPGTFDNVAGLTSFICLSFPIGVCGHYQHRSIYFKALLLTSKVLSILVVMTYGSRTGMLCIGLLCLLLFTPKRLNPLVKWGLFVLLFLSALFIKQESTRGRWFILVQTVQMFLQKPLVGWGHQGFERHYMDVQAEYFLVHPDDTCSMVADNIHHPLNEILLIAVNYGLTGLLVNAFLVMTIVIYYLRHRSRVAKEGMLVLVALAVLSTFSYPLSYPFTWLMLAISVCLVYHGRIRSVVIRTMGSNICGVIMLCIALIGSMATLSHIVWQQEWGKVARMSQYGVTHKTLGRYGEIYQYMKENPFFLYNYASVLHDVRQDEMSLTAIECCDKLYSDYDIQMLKADILMSLGLYRKALETYGLAHRMCPSRFLPYLGMYKAYEITGDEEGMELIRREILRKPLKRDTEEVRNIIKTITKP